MKILFKIFLQLTISVQNWKPYNLDSSPSVDGFLIGNYKNDIQSYIGRTISSGDSQNVIGRIQIAPKSEAGLYYFNTQIDSESSDRSTSVEYLVKNENDTYKWVASSAGKYVRNALRNQEDGKFLIGKVQFDDKIYIGAIEAGRVLTFIDHRGLKQTSKNYEVLTCYSNLVNDQDEEEEGCINW